MADDDKNEGESAISVQTAFLIHVRPDCNLQQGEAAGRVEHVVSGRTMRFESSSQLWAFLASVMARTRPRTP